MKTKPAIHLTASVCALAILAAGTYVLREDPKPEVAPAHALRSLSEAPGAAISSVVPQTSFSQNSFGAEDPAPEDLPALVRTLRGRGVSHGVIRQTVMGKFYEHFEKKRQAIASRPVLTEAARKEQQRLLDELPAVRQRMFTTFLARHRLTSTPMIQETERKMGTAGSPAEPPPDAHANFSEAAVAPAILAPPGPESQMTDWQATEWLRLESDFVESIGGANQDPSDPAYYSRWQTAQQRNDALFRQKFGVSVFLKHNMAAWRNSAE